MPAKLGKLTNSDFHLSLLRAYIDSANDGIFVVCDEMIFHVVNRRLAVWLGETEETLTAHKQRLSITQFFNHHEARKLFIKNFHNTLAGQATRFECRLTPKHADSRWLEVSLSKVDIEVGNLVIGVMRDISERVKILAEVHHQARHDDLTGLVNRREFERRLIELFESSKNSHTQHALLYLDLDQFKVLNDTCGHSAGDELLRQLAIKVLGHIRRHDTFARLGGDEFGVLLEDCQMEQAMEIAEKLRQTISELHFQWKGQSFDISASIGACAIEFESESPSSILSDADSACYVAKDHGRNRVQLFYVGDDSIRQRSEMDWVTRLNQAMQENRLRLYYQKIFPVSNPDQASVHFEVLLRLLDETGNVVVPGVFLPAAEKYGLMPAVDRWVVHNLLSGSEEFHRRLESGGKVICSVNLSGASLNDEHFRTFLREQIAISHVPPQALCFEITETIAISNLPRVVAFMRELKDIGCCISLDDFGSGMSSFGYLKTLPVDYLKIDGILIKNIADDVTDYAMVQSINRIGHLMGLRTIAEFVETTAILMKLREIGVDFAQGFGLHKPESL
ncbi:MAG: putative bifunctional diguanylate cyclase/phosphodiesterase [Sulfuricaulis sp.]